MKKLLPLLALLALASAHATNTTPPKPDPNINVNAGAAAGAAAKAGADASSKSSAAGGAADSLSTATGGSSDASGGANSFASDSRFYVLPAPMYAPPMAHVDCPSANVDLKGGSVGWSFASGYHHVTDSSDCTLIQLRNSKVESCQYASAKQIEDLLTLKYLPAYKPSDDARFADLTPAECRMIKTPVPAPKQEATLLTGPGLKPVAAAECAAPPVKKAPPRKAAAPVAKKADDKCGPPAKPGKMT